MNASIDVDDVNDLLDVELPTSESDTLGGLIYSKLGRVPLPGEEVEIDPKVTVKVEKVEGRRIRSVEVRLIVPSTPEELREEAANREEAAREEAADEAASSAAQKVASES